ncbi:MAG: hypothetical protein J6T19_07985 [Paludibacteraceae bacterium]|jgi:hypothetical protein|nr:hypothetical protein [Paludibacteraceae bacterium]MBR4547614.1 hypothetical protein [Paludibacteraceae bacterium]
MKKSLIILSLTLLSLAAWAVPANPRPMEYVQPNGDTIVIRLVGDEHFHFTTTVDGVLIAKNDKGYYCYAKWQEIKEDGQTYRVAKPTCRKARNAAKRSKCEQRWIARQQAKAAKKQAKK